MIETEDSQGFRDRSAGLVVLGVIVILIGLGHALLAALTVLLMVGGAVLDELVASPGGVGGTLAGVLVYLLLGGAFVWLGIGSVLARRWAHALLLVLSWIWLVTGVCTVALLVALAPMTGELIASLSGLERSAVLLIQAGVLMVSVGLYVILPGVMVLFYRSPDTQATCRWRDRQVRWTDDCPAHILSLCVLYFLTAVSLLLIPASGWGLPVFGLVLKGWPATLLVVLGVVLCGWLIRDTALRNLRAWWVGVAATLVAAVATTVTVAVVPVTELFTGSAGEEQYLAELIQVSPAWVVAGSLVTWLSLLGYLGYVRRFFRWNRAH